MTQLSFRQLQVIRAVVRDKTLTEAARTLNVSQPAISRVLKHAEDQLGIALFHRKGGRLIPTSEVRSLVPDIEKVFTNLDYIQRAAGDIARLRRGRVRIAAIPSIATTLLARSVGDFVVNKPDISISVQTLLNQEVVDWVVDRQVDFGIAFLPPEHEEVVREEIHRTRLVAVMLDTHPYAQKSSITIEDLHKESFISFSRMLPIGQLIDEQFQNAGVARRISVEIGVSFIACVMAQNGAGIALIDHLVVESGIFPNLKVLPFEPSIDIPVYLLYPNEQPPSILASAFIEQIKKSIASGSFK